MIEIRSLRDLLRLYFIFRSEFRRAFVATLVLVLAGIVLMPPKYTSDARLLVKPGRENMLTPLDIGDRQAMATQVTTRDPILDEEKMLTGRPVLARVASAYLKDAANQPAPQGAWQSLKAKVRQGREAVGGGLRSVFQALGLAEPRTPEEELAERLAARFTVTHGPGSNVMDITFTWDDPVAAQRILSTWLQVFSDERTSVLGRKSLVSFYDDKVRESDRSIQSVKAQLQKRLQGINGISARERLDTITVRINALTGHLSEIKGEQSALAHGINFATTRASRLPAEAVTDRELGNSATWQALSVQLAELKRQKVDTLRVFKDTAPAVTALNESIASLEAQMRAESKDVQRSERRGPNELSTSMQRSQLEKSMRLQELNAMEANYSYELRQLEIERQKVMAQEPELARLEQELGSAEKSRGLYLDNLERARIDQALDDSRINNVAQVQQASLNPGRSSPKPFTLLLLSLPMATLAGLMVIYLCALFDQRIHDGGRMEERFGAPLWTSVKDLAAGRNDPEFQASLYRVLGVLSRERIDSQGLVLGLTSARAGEGTRFLAGHLRTVLEARGVAVEVNPSEVVRAPGKVVLVHASGVCSNPEVFPALGQVDQIVLIVEARASTVAQVEGALTALRTAFQKVDGIILNRRQFEVPASVMRWLQA